MEKQSRGDNVEIKDSDLLEAKNRIEIVSKCENENYEKSKIEIISSTKLSSSSENVSEKDYFEIPGKDLKRSKCTRIVIIGDCFLSSYHEFWPTDSKIQPYFLFKNKLSIDEVYFKFQDHPFLKNSKRIIVLFVLGLHDFAQYGTHVHKPCSGRHKNIQYIEDLKSIKGYAKKLLEVKEKYSGNENLSVLFSYFPSLHNVRLLKEIFNYSKDESLDCGCSVNDLDCVAENFIKSDFFAITQIYQRYMTTVQINVIRDYGVFEYIAPAISYINGEWKLTMDGQTKKNIAVLNHVLNEFIFDIDGMDENKVINAPAPYKGLRPRCITGVISKNKKTTKKSNIRVELSTMRNLIVKKNFRIALIGDKWIASVAYQWPDSHLINPFFYFQDNFMFRDLRKAILTLVKGDEYATVIVTMPAGEFFTMRSSAKCEGHKSLEYPVPNESILKDPVEFANLFIEKLSTLMKEIKQLRKNCVLVLVNCYPVQLTSYCKYLTEAHSQTVGESAHINSLPSDVNFSEFDTKLSQCFDMINQYIETTNEVHNYPVCDIAQVVNSSIEKFIFPTYIEDIYPSTYLAKELFNLFKLYIEIFNRTSLNNIVSITLADQYARKLKMVEMKKKHKIATNSDDFKRNNEEQLESYWSSSDSDIESNDSLLENIPSSEECLPTDNFRSLAMLDDQPSFNIQSKEPCNIIICSEDCEQADSLDVSVSLGNQASVDTLKSLSMLDDQSSLNIQSKEPSQEYQQACNKNSMSEDLPSLVESSLSEDRLSVDRSLVVLGDRSSLNIQFEPSKIIGLSQNDVQINDENSTTMVLAKDNSTEDNNINCKNPGLYRSENSYLALENTPVKISADGQKIVNVENLDEVACGSHKNESSNDTVHLPKDRPAGSNQICLAVLNNCYMDMVMESNQATNGIQSDSNCDTAKKSRKSNNETKCLVENPAFLKIRDVLIDEQSVDPTENSVKRLRSDAAWQKKESENDNGCSLSEDGIRPHATLDDNKIIGAVLKEADATSGIEDSISEAALANEDNLIAEISNSNSLPESKLKNEKRQGMEMKENCDESTMLYADSGLNEPPETFLMMDNQVLYDDEANLDSDCQASSDKKHHIKSKDSVSKSCTSSGDHPSNDILRSLALLADQPSGNILSKELSEEISKTASKDCPLLEVSPVSSEGSNPFNILSEPVYVQNSMIHEGNVIKRLPDLNSLSARNLESTNKEKGLKRKKKVNSSKCRMLSAKAGLTDSPAMNQESVKIMQVRKKKQNVNSSGCTGAKPVVMSDPKLPVDNRESGKEMQVINVNKNINCSEGIILSGKLVERNVTAKQVKVIKKKKKITSNGCTILNANQAGNGPPPVKQENTKKVQVIKKKKIASSGCTILGTTHTDNGPPPINKQESAKKVQIIKKKKIASSGCTILDTTHTDNGSPPINKQESAKKVKIIKKKKIANTGCTILGTTHTDNGPPPINKQESAKKVQIIKKKKIASSGCTILGTTHTDNGPPPINKQESAKKVQIIKKKKIASSGCTILGTTHTDNGPPPINKQESAKKVQIIKKKKIASSGCTILGTIHTDNGPPPINKQESAKKVQIIKKKKIASSGCTILGTTHTENGPPPINKQESAKKIQIIKMKKKISSTGCTMLSAEQVGVNGPKLPVNEQESAKKVQVFKKKKITGNGCVVLGAKHAGVNDPKLPVNKQESAKKVQVLKNKKKITNIGCVVLGAKHAGANRPKPLEKQENVKKIQIMKKKLPSSGSAVSDAKHASIASKSSPSSEDRLPVNVLRFLAMLGDRPSFGNQPEEPSKKASNSQKRKQASNDKTSLKSHPLSSTFTLSAISNRSTAMADAKDVKSTTASFAGKRKVLKNAANLDNKQSNNASAIRLKSGVQSNRSMVCSENTLAKANLISELLDSNSLSKTKECEKTKQGIKRKKIVKCNASKMLRVDRGMNQVMPDEVYQDTASQNYFKTPTSSLDSDCQNSSSKRLHMRLKDSMAKSTSSGQLPFTTQSKNPSNIIQCSQKSKQTRNDDSQSNVSSGNRLSGDVLRFLAVLGDRPSFDQSEPSNLANKSKKGKQTDIEKQSCNRLTLDKFSTSGNHPSPNVLRSQTVLGDRPNLQSKKSSYIVSSSQKSKQGGDEGSQCKDHPSLDRSSSLVNRPSSNVLKFLAVLGDRPSFNVQSEKPNKNISGSVKRKQTDNEDLQSSNYPSEDRSTSSGERPQSNILRSLAVLDDRPSFIVQPKEPNKDISSSQKSKQAADKDSQCKDRPSLDRSSSSINRPSSDVLKFLAVLGDRPSFNVQSKEPNKNISGSVKRKQTDDEDSQSNNYSSGDRSSSSGDRPRSDILRSLALLGDRPSFNIQSHKSNNLVSDSQKSKEACSTDPKTLSKDRASLNVLRSSTDLGNRPTATSDEKGGKATLPSVKVSKNSNNANDHSDSESTGSDISDSKTSVKKKDMVLWYKRKSSSPHKLRPLWEKNFARAKNKSTYDNMTSTQLQSGQVDNTLLHRNSLAANAQGYSDYQKVDAQLHSDQIQCINDHHKTNMQFPCGQTQSGSQMKNVQDYNDQQTAMLQFINQLASIQSREDLASYLVSIQGHSDHQMINTQLQSSQNLHNHDDNQINNTYLQSGHLVGPSPGNFQLPNQSYDHISNMQLQSGQLACVQPWGNPQITNVQGFENQITAQLQSDRLVNVQARGESQMANVQGYIASQMAGTQLQSCQLASIPAQGECQMSYVQGYNDHQMNSAQAQSYQGQGQGQRSHEMASAYTYETNQSTNNVQLPYHSSATDGHQINDMAHSVSYPNPAPKSLTSKVIPASKINSPDTVLSFGKRNREFYNELSKALMNNSPDVEDLISIVHNIVSDYKSNDPKVPFDTRDNANNGTSHQAQLQNRNLSSSFKSHLMAGDHPASNAAVQSGMSSGYLENKELFCGAQIFPFVAGDVHRSVTRDGRANEDYLNDDNVMSSNIQMNNHSSAVYNQGTIEEIMHSQPVRSTGYDHRLVAENQQATSVSMTSKANKSRMDKDFNVKPVQKPPEIQPSVFTLQSLGSFGHQNDKKLESHSKKYVLSDSYINNYEVQSDMSGVIPSGYQKNKESYFGASQIAETEYENPKILSSNRKLHMESKDSVHISSSSSGDRPSVDILRSLAMLGDRPSFNVQSKKTQKSKQVDGAQSKDQLSPGGSTPSSKDCATFDILRAPTMVGDWSSFNRRSKESSKLISSTQSSRQAGNNKSSDSFLGQRSATSENSIIVISDDDDDINHHQGSSNKRSRMESNSVSKSSSLSEAHPSSDILKSLALLGDRPSFNVHSKEHSKKISGSKKCKQTNNEDWQSNRHSSVDESATSSENHKRSDIHRSLALLDDQPSFNVQSKKPCIASGSQKSQQVGIAGQPNDSPSLNISASSSRDRPSIDILRSIAMLGDRPSFNNQLKKPSNYTDSKTSDNRPSLDISVSSPRDRPSADILRSIAMLGDRPSFNVQPKKPSNCTDSKTSDDHPSLDISVSSPRDRRSSDILRSPCMTGDDRRLVAATRNHQTITTSEKDCNIKTKKSRRKGDYSRESTQTYPENSSSKGILRSRASTGDRGGEKLQDPSATTWVLR